jgi:putative two-component system response regulator
LELSALPSTPHSPSLLEAASAEPALRDAQYSALTQLAVAAERGGDRGLGHPARVGTIAQAVARELGLGAFAVAWLGQAAPLHDVGKLVIPNLILSKPRRLSAAEFEIVKHHTRAGAEMLSGSGSRLLGLAREIALSHHERWDGGGYPMGLRGESIPFGGRIVAIADVFDALTHARPYKDAWAVESAADEICRQRETHFDPAVVDAFLAVLDRIPLAHPELALI